MEKKTLDRVKPISVNRNIGESDHNEPQKDTPRQKDKSKEGRHRTPSTLPIAETRQMKRNSAYIGTGYDFFRHPHRSMFLPRSRIQTANLTTEQDFQYRVDPKNCKRCQQGKKMDISITDNYNLVIHYAMRNLEPHNCPQRANENSLIAFLAVKIISKEYPQGETRFYSPTPELYTKKRFQIRTFDEFAHLMDHAATCFADMKLYENLRHTSTYINNLDRLQLGFDHKQPMDYSTDPLTSSRFRLWYQHHQTGVLPEKQDETTSISASKSTGDSTSASTGVKSANTSASTSVKSASASVKSANASVKSASASASTSASTNASTSASTSASTITASASTIPTSASASASTIPISASASASTCTSVSLTTPILTLFPVIASLDPTRERYVVPPPFDPKCPDWECEPTIPDANLTDWTYDPAIHNSENPPLHTKTIKKAHGPSWAAHLPSS